MLAMALTVWVVDVVVVGDGVLVLRRQNFGELQYCPVRTSAGLGLVELGVLRLILGLILQQLLDHVNFVTHWTTKDSVFRFSSTDIRISHAFLRLVTIAQVATRVALYCGGVLSAVPRHAQCRSRCVMTPLTMETRSDSPIPSYSPRIRSWDF